MEMEMEMEMEMCPEASSTSWQQDTVNWPIAMQRLAEDKWNVIGPQDRYRILYGVLTEKADKVGLSKCCCWRSTPRKLLIGQEQGWSLD